jgi:hypothetical protein
MTLQRPESASNIPLTTTPAIETHFLVIPGLNSKSQEKQYEEVPLSLLRPSRRSNALRLSDLSRPYKD